MLKQTFYSLIAACFFMLAQPAALSAQEVHEEEVQEPEASDDAGADAGEQMQGNRYQPEEITEEAPPQTPAIAAPPATQPTAPVSSTGVPVPAATQPAPPVDSGDTNFDTVMLQGLNKVTAARQTLEAPIGSVIRFGTIEIIAHKCWKASPDERPENAALLEVSEIKQGEAPQHIFSGWMFSSTPALSSLEHPFYDVTVVGCGKSALKP